MPDPTCDTCGERVVWNEIEGWRHTDAEHPFGMFRCADLAGHVPTARRWHEAVTR